METEYLTQEQLIGFDKYKVSYLKVFLRQKQHPGGVYLRLHTLFIGKQTEIATINQLSLITLNLIFLANKRPGT